MALATPALEIRNLHKRYGELEVLKGISLTARDGDVISILGSSGSGKSTLLRCINLLENPHEGQILVAGEELKLKKAKSGELVAADGKQINRMRSELGFVFQNFNLWPHMTILDNIIEAPRRVLGQSKAEATEVAEALLAKVGIADKRHVYPNQLSGGQQQRAAIARTLAMQPKVILFDAHLGAGPGNGTRSACGDPVARRGRPDYAARHPRNEFRQAGIQRSGVPPPGSGRGAGNARAGI